MQIYLVTPLDIADDFVTAFADAMRSGEVAAVLIRRGERSEDEYAASAEKLLPLAQDEDIAVLLDDMPGLVRRLGADGAHLTSGIGGFNEAVELIKPEFIAGAGDLRSRHEAMLRGESGADYLMFGSLDDPLMPEDREEAEWWAETFEIPAALANTATPITEIEPAACEFMVLGSNIWTHADGPAASLKIARQRLGEP